MPDSGVWVLGVGNGGAGLGRGARWWIIQSVGMQWVFVGCGCGGSIVVVVLGGWGVGSY